MPAGAATAATAAAVAAEAAATSSAPRPTRDSGRISPGAAGARLQTLYEEHAALVLGLCRLLLRDAGEAEDAAQQAFLSAYRALLGGVVPREPAAWLATIARNECRTRARSRMRAPLTVELAADLPDPLAVPVARMDLGAIRAALAALPARQREAFLLREFGGLSYDELAVALGLTVPAIESLLLRARSRLRVTLAPLREALPSLGRLLPWPFAAKVAATTMGATLLVGGTLYSREDGGPARADSLPTHSARAIRTLDRPRPVRAAVPAPAFALPQPVVRTTPVRTPPPIVAPRRTAHEDVPKAIERSDPVEASVAEPTDPPEVVAGGQDAPDTVDAMDAQPQPTAGADGGGD